MTNSFLDRDDNAADRFDSVLRTLDPAAPASEPNSTRARADLERILATDHAEPVSLRTGVRRSRSRLAIGLAAASVVAAGAVVAPSLMRNGSPAFAAYTPAPTELTGDARASAADDCGAGTPLIAEQRGPFDLVVVSSASSFTLCVSDQDDWSFGAAGDVGATPSPREIEPVTLGWGGSDEEPISLAAGPVGSQVRKVEIATEEYGTVQASVSGGWFALWFPGKGIGEEKSGPAHGVGKTVESQPTSDVSAGVPVKVTYADGSVRTVTLDLD